MNSSGAELNLNSQGISANRYFLSALALFILPVSGLAIDIYVPSLPAVSQYFNIDKSLVQLSITAYMIGLGIMQLFAGSISDSFGRRQPYLISMFLFVIATLFIPFTANIQQLLLLRFIQGAAVAVSVVPLRSVISDLFEGEEYYKMVTYMTMTWSIGPIIAPAIGGYLQHYLGWKSNFYFLGIYSLISFVLNFYFLPDTSRHHLPFKLMPIISRYTKIMASRVFIISLLMNSLLYSISILFAVVASFLIETKLHYSSVEFGHVALLTGFAWFLGTMSNRILINVPMLKRFRISYWGMFGITMAALLISFFMHSNIYLLVIPTLLLELLGGSVFPNNFARVISMFPEASGSANALFSGFLFLLTGLSSAFGVLLKSNSLMPLILTYAVITILLLILLSLDSQRKTGLPREALKKKIKTAPGFPAALRSRSIQAYTIIFKKITK